MKKGRIEVTSQGPYKIGRITRLTGFSSVLLRAWERRYELLNPKRGSGGHRMYTDDDLKVLERVRSLLDQGRAIGEIAALGREYLLADPAAPSVGDRISDPFQGLEKARKDLVEAALVLDARVLNQRMDDLAACYSSDQIVEEIMRPVAKEIGDLWQVGKCSVASEHLISSVFKHRILKLIEVAESLVERPCAMAACLPGEEHELGLLMACYFMNRSAIRVLYLGKSVPLEDCRHAFDVAKPDAILFSVTIKRRFRTHRAEIMSMVDGITEPVLFYLGGQGVPRSDSDLETRAVRLVRPDKSVRDAAVEIASEMRSKPVHAAEGGTEGA
jgi:DNA-binding transcriptional MerR regulator